MRARISSDLVPGDIAGPCGRTTSRWDHFAPDNAPGGAPDDVPDTFPPRFPTAFPAAWRDHVQFREA
jgi:hypothetical protein